MVDDHELYVRKRRRAVLFIIVGIWGIYHFYVSDDFNPLWVIPAVVLGIVSAYNFYTANQAIQKNKPGIDEA